MLALSVIIATYNRSSCLLRTLNSLIEQDLAPQLWEVIVVDNNSVDQTKSECESYISANSGFNINYLFEQAQGLSHARNAGISVARGRYIVIVDDDEVFVKGFLSAYFNLFESNPKARVAGGRVLPLYEYQVPKWLGSITERPIAGTVDFNESTLLFPSTRYPTGGNMAFRSDVFAEFGVFNPELGRTGDKLMGGEEKDLFERLSSLKIYYLHAALMYHIIPQARMSTDYLYKVSLMIGRSERFRTKARGIYLKRCFLELIKWAGTIVYSLGYILVGRPSAARVLCGLRLRITQGLLGK